MDTFFQDKICDGGLSEQFLSFLDQLDNIKPPERNPQDFVIDPLTTSRAIKSRDPNMANIFTPMELDFYNQMCKARTSFAEGNNWLRVFLRVRLLMCFVLNLCEQCCCVLCVELHDGVCAAVCLVCLLMWCVPVHTNTQCCTLQARVMCVDTRVCVLLCFVCLLPCCVPVHTNTQHFTLQACVMCVETRCCVLLVCCCGV